MIVPIILSGGVGSRLWPLSREHLPKQMMPLLGARYSLFQNTIMRLGGIAAIAPPLIVCNEHHRFMAASQMQEIGANWSDIILEPEGKNTCPAITAGTLAAMKNGEDPDILVLPADHLLKEVQRFARAVEQGAKLTSTGRIITFGIVPDKPETGYGYIHRGESLAGGEDGEAFAVLDFQLFDGNTPNGIQN